MHFLASKPEWPRSTVRSAAETRRGSKWTGSRFRHTGQIALPEASLYHYKARVYDRVLGRFLQTDPVRRTTLLHLMSGGTSGQRNPALHVPVIAKPPSDSRMSL